MSKRVDQRKHKRAEIAVLTAKQLLDLLIPDWEKMLFRELRFLIKRLIHPRHRRECLAAAEECAPRKRKTKPKTEG